MRGVKLFQQELADDCDLYAIIAKYNSEVQEGAFEKLDSTFKIK